ncbi:MAG: hypothetical protein ACFFCV_22075 [Promethearchaeota archaeon]
MIEKQMTDMIKDYLKEVKSKLPEWLKDKKEHTEILAELEDHIWSKAEELSGMGQPTVESVQMAISHMGTPENIAKEYKRRGTPKVYITMELWPYYLKALGILFAVVIGITLISQVVDFIFGNVDIGQFFGNIFLGIQNGCFAIFAIITLIFVGLSMEGYFPEDFKSKKIREKEKQELELAREQGIPITEIKKRPIKPYIKPVEVIIGGVISIVFGVFLIVLPIPAVTSLIEAEFLLYVSYAGLYMVVEGILDLSRGLLGNRKFFAHQILHGFTIGIKLASISVVVLMMNRPEIFPILVVNEPGAILTNIGISPEYYEIFRGIAGVIIVIIILTTIEDFYRIIKAEKYKFLK